VREFWMRGFWSRAGVLFRVLITTVRLLVRDF